MNVYKQIHVADYTIDFGNWTHERQVKINREFGRRYWGSIVDRTAADIVWEEFFMFESMDSKYKISSKRDTQMWFRQNRSNGYRPTCL